jgi:hypothetical protein
MNTLEQTRRMIGASWGQSPGAAEAGIISTSRRVAVRVGLREYALRLIEAS